MRGRPRPLAVEKRNGGLGGPVADGVMANGRRLVRPAASPALDSLTDVEVSSLPAAALTAWHALTRASSLRPEATGPVEGTDGVCLFALQIAVAAGVSGDRHLEFGRQSSSD